MSFNFCAGKATWYSEISVLFEQCLVTYETGLLPRKGSLADQDEMFTEVFPLFVMRYKDRQYGRIWSDVRETITQVLEAIFGKKGS